MITNIEVNSPAKQTGLKVNDLIIDIDNQPILSFRNAFDIVADIWPETTVPFKIIWRWDNCGISRQHQRRTCMVNL
ncbi:PDZ domain-containing protein [Candidatus Enterovibrio escicola]|uniref:PDZ domain-containing protein n=1 Tax=Candidatus Enterovibrio escicola TaxID=1927127 RepID=UPI001CC22AB5|nr:PDZ domain-containing protein [Candidatus Enterovibrio escacola]